MVVNSASDADLDDLARRINQEHGEVVRSENAAVEAANHAGGLLRTAKEQLPHGSWRAWVAANLHFDLRTAERYMAISRNWPQVERALQTTERSFITIQDAARMRPGTQVVSVSPAYGTVHQIRIVSSARQARAEHRRAASADTQHTIADDYPNVTRRVANLQADLALAYAVLVEMGATQREASMWLLMVRDQARAAGEQLNGDCEFDLTWPIVQVLSRAATRLGLDGHLSPDFMDPTPVV